MAQPAVHMNTLAYVTNNPNIPVLEAAAYRAARLYHTETDQIAAFTHHWRAILPASLFKLLSALMTRVRLNKQTWEKHETFRCTYADLAQETGMSARTIQRMLHRAASDDIVQWQQHETHIATLVDALQQRMDTSVPQVAQQYGITLQEAARLWRQAEQHCLASDTPYAPLPCPWHVGDFTWTYRHQTYTLGDQTYTMNQLLRLFIRKIERSTYRSSTYQHAIYGDTVFEMVAIVPLPPTAAAAQELHLSCEEVVAARHKLSEQAAVIQANETSCTDRTSCPVDRADNLSDLSPCSYTTTIDTDLSISLERNVFPIATETTRQTEGDTPASFRVAGETIRKTNDTAANDSIPYQTRTVSKIPPCESTNESDTPPPLRATPPSPVLSAEAIHGEAWRAVARQDAASVLLWNYARLKYPALVTSIDALVGDVQNLYARKGEDDRDDWLWDGQGWWEPRSEAPAQAISWWEIRKDLRSAIEQVLTVHAPVGQLKGTTPKHLAELADLAQKRLANHRGTTKNLAGYYLTTLKNLRREYLLKQGDMEQLRLAEKKQQVRNAAKQDGVVLPVNTAPPTPTRVARAKQGWGETSSDPARSRGYNPRG